MSLQSLSPNKPVETFLESLKEACPDASMRDVAVLFTDVVGSTTYFKTHGDIKGRAMLRKHHTMAISIVEEYGGSLIKEVGDSVMVYFPDAVNAVKASIKMQHRFAEHNKKNNSEDEIHVRVGIHFGRVIVEEKDIYGDVVNVAAKLTNLANGDQLFVSLEVYELTKTLPSVNFELINFWSLKSIPAGLTIYKVAWEQAPILQPDRVAILYLCPVTVGEASNQAGPYQALWNGFIEKKAQYLDNRHREEQTLSDNTLILTYPDSSTALEIAERIFKHLSDEVIKMDPAGKPFFYIMLTWDTDPRETRLPMDKTCVKPEGLHPGGIYISAPFYEDLKKKKTISLTPSPEASPGLPFYTYLNESAEQVQEPVNLRKATAEGDLGPCFYCGNKNHYPRNCPSKLLTERSQAVAKMGYLPMSSIDRLFSLRPSAESPAPHSGLHGIATPAEEGIITDCLYELKNIYQLRFFRAIWGSRSEEWNKARKNQSAIDGGFAWLAFDSFRVSNAERAEAYIRTAQETDKKDYRTHCITGFIRIEKNDFAGALAAFDTALTLTRTNPQKIFIHFIQARIYTLQKNTQKAREKIRGILLIDPDCTEALYQDVLFSLRENSEKSVLQKLRRLIADDRDYYVMSLIEPEKGEAANAINGELLGLFDKSKDEALRSVEDTKAKINRMRDTLSAKDTNEIDGIMSGIQDLLGTDSYFGYLDVYNLAINAESICDNALRNQKKDLTDITAALGKQLKKHMDFVDVYRYPQFLGSISNQLKGLRAKLTELEHFVHFSSSWQFDYCHKGCNEIVQELKIVGPKLDNLDLLQQIITMSLNFLKYSSIFFSIVFFIGVFLFPLAADHLSSFLSRFDVSPSSNVWSFQKGFLIVGGIISLVISFCIMVRKAVKDEPYSSK